jgi:hypothetical protein
MRCRNLLLLIPVVIAACTESPAAPDDRPQWSTNVPGHQNARNDQDGNGYPDVGVIVNGKYQSLYAYDASGNWYWNLGDGRIYGTVTSLSALNAATLSRCDYQVQYRGMFQNNPYQDNGWIINNIICSGYDGTASYNYLIVHKTDPRYRGTAARIHEWGPDWEYHALTVTAWGNLVRPENGVGS